MIKYLSDFRLKRYRNQALQKLGRNLYNFGLVERWLKFIVTVSDVTIFGTKSGPMLDSKTKRKTEKTQRMMLGQLINEIFELWNPEATSSDSQLQLFDISLKTSMKIEMSLESYQQLKNSYEVMLSDRNFLIHQFNEKFPLYTIESCSEAIASLDEMREKHLPAIHHLQETVKTFLELSKDLQSSLE